MDLLSRPVFRHLYDARATGGGGGGGNDDDLGFDVELSKMRQYWHPNLQRTVTSDNADRNQMESYSRMQEGALGVKTRLVILLGFGRDEVGAGLACTEDFDNGRVQHLAEFGLNLKGNSSTNCLR